MKKLLFATVLTAVSIGSFAAPAAKPAAKKAAGPSDEQLAAVAAAVVAHKIGK